MDRCCSFAGELCFGSRFASIDEDGVFMGGVEEASQPVVRDSREEPAG